MWDIIDLMRVSLIEFIENKYKHINIHFYFTLYFFTLNTFADSLPTLSLRGNCRASFSFPISRPSDRLGSWPSVVVLWIRLQVVHWYRSTSWNFSVSMISCTASWSGYLFLLIHYSCLLTSFGLISLWFFYFFRFLVFVVTVSAFPNSSSSIVLLNCIIIINFFVFIGFPISLDFVSSDSSIYLLSR